MIVKILGIIFYILIIAVCLFLAFMSFIIAEETKKLREGDKENEEIMETPELRS